MTPVAVTFLVLSAVLVWGGLIASAIALSIHPERRMYPPHADDAESAATDV